MENYVCVVWMGGERDLPGGDGGKGLGMKEEGEMTMIIVGGKLSWGFFCEGVEEILNVFCG